MLFGAHVSIAGDIRNAPQNAANLGCEVFQMFTRSPQGGFTPPITESIGKEFQDQCKAFNQKEWVVHAPYIINFASANNRIRFGSIKIVREELERSSLLGAKYLMAHLGSYKDLGHDLGLAQVAEGLAEMLKGYKGRTLSVPNSHAKRDETQFLIEISAGAGEIIGDTFEEIAEIIYHPKLKKYDIGVCYDTQHAYASGYDCRTPATVDSTLKKFDKIIGLSKLKMFHCNDSKIELGGKKDRHEHIGDGEIGLGGFKTLLSDKRLQDINFYLETEHDLVEKDLNILKKIRG